MKSVLVVGGLIVGAFMLSGCSGPQGLQNLDTASNTRLSAAVLRSADGGQTFLPLARMAKMA